MSYNAKAENALDLRYKRDAGWLHRLILRLFRSHINAVCKIVIFRAYERGIVDSETMHELAGIVDKILFPERFRLGGWSAGNQQEFRKVKEEQTT